MKNIKATSGESNFFAPQGRKGKILFLLIFTVLHMLLTVLLFLASFSMVMSYADTKPLPASGEMLYLVSQIFQWPLLVPLGQIEILRDILPVYFIFIFLFLNSLVWALTALGIIIGLRWFQHRISVSHP